MSTKWIWWKNWFILHDDFLRLSFLPLCLVDRKVHGKNWNIWFLLTKLSPSGRASICFQSLLLSWFLDELLDFISCLCLVNRKDHGTIGIFESYFAKLSRGGRSSIRFPWIFFISSNKGYLRHLQSLLLYFSSNLSWYDALLVFRVHQSLSTKWIW